jgi:hypothetical protein
MMPNEEEVVQAEEAAEAAPENDISDAELPLETPPEESEAAPVDEEE